MKCYALIFHFFLPYLLLTLKNTFLSHSYFLTKRLSQKKITFSQSGNVSHSISGVHQSWCQTGYAIKNVNSFCVWKDFCTFAAYKYRTGPYNADFHV